MATKLVIFDFDGVLTDSYDVCIKVSRHFNPDLSDSDYKVLFTGNIYQALEEGKSANLTVKTVDNDLYFELYEPLILEVPPREGFKQIIQDIYNKGIKIAFISSCYNKPLKKYLLKYGFSEYIAEVLGGDIEKSKVKKFNRIFNDLNITPQESIFITDTLGDLNEAETVALPSIGVTFGFHNRELIEKGKTISIADSIPELQEQIFKNI